MIYSAYDERRRYVVAGYNVYTHSDYVYINSDFDLSECAVQVKRNDFLWFIDI